MCDERGDRTELAFPPPLVPATTTVFEVAVVEPLEFVAVTFALNRWPASALATVYVLACAPVIGEQEPLLVQRSQA